MKKLKAMIVSISVMSLSYGFAAGKPSITVFPLGFQNEPDGGKAAEALSSAFASLSSVNYKKAEEGKFKAQMTISAENEDNYRESVRQMSGKEKLIPVRYGSTLSGSFTSSKAGLAGLRLRVFAYGRLPECKYFILVKDILTSAVVRAAVIPVSQKDEVADVDVTFAPILNSKGKSYVLTVEPAGIEMDGIIGISIVNAEKGSGSIFCTPLFADFSVTNTIKNKPAKVSDISSADYIVFSHVIGSGSSSSLNISLYSADDELIVFTDEELFVEDNREACCLALAERAATTLSGKLPAALIPEPTKGTSEQSIFVSWKPALEGFGFAVYRSAYIDGPYVKIGTSATSSYIDGTAEPGILYWYRIQAVSDRIKSDLSIPASGYRKIPAKGEDINKLLAGKRLSPLAERTAARKKTAADEQKFLKEYYMNRVQMSVFMNIGKSYVNKGAISVFETPETYSLNLKEREILLLGDNALISFYAKKLFRIRESTMPLYNVIAKIEFGSSGNADAFGASGFSSPPQKDLRWNEGSAASLEIDVGRDTGDLLVDMHLAPPWAEEPYTCKKLEVLANDNSVGYVTVTGNGMYRVKVPGSLITEGKLRLGFVVRGTRSDDKSLPPKTAFYSVAVSKQVMAKDLFTRLIDNGVFYCVYEKDVPVRMHDGRVKYVPMYKAAGMSTEYYKNNKNWKSSTVIVTTSDNELMKKIKKETQKKQD